MFVEWLNSSYHEAPQLVSKPENGRLLTHPSPSRDKGPSSQASPVVLVYCADRLSSRMRIIPTATE